MQQVERMSGSLSFIDSYSSAAAGSRAVEQRNDIRWEPAVYEQKAALIGRSPAAVARSSDLLTAAVLAELEAYQADAVTVGVDVYNLEAEAFGAKPVAASWTACPDVTEPLWRISEIPRELEPPPVPAAGRFHVMLDAAQRVRDSVEARYCAYTLMPRRPTVRVAASGPTSIASRLIDPQELLIGLLADDPAVDRLLEICTVVGEHWLSTIRAAGLDAVIIDSLASPPLIGPRLYEEKVYPLHHRLMEFLDATGQVERPLVMGGDTSDVIALMAAAGANVLLADVPADVRSFVAELRSSCSAGRLADVRIRRNIDPAFCVVPIDDQVVNRYVRDFEAIIEAGLSVTIGTGILDYHQDPSAVRMVAARVMEALGR